MVVSAGDRTILVVEDERSVRNLAVKLLQSAGYTVLAVEDGPEALRLVESPDVRVDLLLTDVVLPGMSGPDLARRCAQLHPAIKVLFTSGYADDSVQHRGVLEGGFHFIGKPYSRADLTRKVREVLGS